ncbi:unnamed protein product [Owenia fusiformis]|uniref:Uncharacterized protein n=1 Tax=Owenia fusiformis TaxID=6347 RepID=A0A8S4NQ24_OWEFU|nr:unnamed protein product [Owenia fusiformis]
MMIAACFRAALVLLLICWSLSGIDAKKKPRKPTCKERVQKAQNILGSLSNIKDDCNVKLTCPSGETPVDKENELTVLESMKSSVDRMANCTCARTGTGRHGYTVKSNYEAFDYPVIFEDEVRWKLFWWFKANTSWPALVSDILQEHVTSDYDSCDEFDDTDNDYDSENELNVAIEDLLRTL